MKPKSLWVVCDKDGREPIDGEWTYFQTYCEAKLHKGKCDIIVEYRAVEEK